MFSLTEEQAVPELSQSPRAQVVYHPETHSLHDCEYLLEIAGRAGLGGLFLATDHPLPRGTVLALEIEATGKDGAFAPLRGRGIVCWRRRWGKPRGMHVVFFEIEGLGQPARPDSRAARLRMSSLPALS
ncbi:MAG TPA: hypothetical protein VEW48_24260 [Thermoanaerobaculia bacterium]|nr:hypothetical protein [Thermoanaerobaculia bacterium]